MATVRAPAVAGMFYPSDPAVLQHMVAGFIEAEAGADTAAGPFKAIIAPHAGYPYSGPIAGTVYAALRPLASQIRRVVLLGPAHRLGFAGIAAPTADGLATPLGVVPVDRAALALALEVPGVRLFDEAFAGEHALEVHLPFLQHLFTNVAVVPLLVGSAAPPLVETVLERLWGGPETLIVISSDLSHYLPYASARKADLETSQAIEGLQTDRLSGQSACGYLPISGLLRRAAALDLRVTTLDLRTSGDTAGERSQVVGYGGYGFEEAATARLGERHREHLLAAARRGLVHAAARGQALSVIPEDYPLPLRAFRATFVTLTQAGQLRGCIGTILPTAPLVTDVVQNTFRAAMQDRRFGALSPRDVERTAIAISILSHPRPMAIRGTADLLTRLRPHHDGLILVDGPRQSLFLPKVWEMLPDPALFVAQLKQKAGLAADHDAPSLQAYRFTTESFPETPAC
ncbi:MAG: AmmeMemoRadiSam system protein B [Rhodospirillaceae bacterium]